MVVHCRSITIRVARQQYSEALAIYPPSSIVDCLTSPSSGGQKTNTVRSRYQWLAEINRRLETIRVLVKIIAESSINVLPRTNINWKHLIIIGLHLCYQIYDRPSYAKKTEFIQSLPLMSLAIVYVTIQISQKAARKLSSGIMNPRYQPTSEPVALMNVAQSFQDCLLLRGPVFLLYTLDHKLDRSGANMILYEHWRLAMQAEMTDHEQPPQQTPHRHIPGIIGNQVITKKNTASNVAYDIAWDVVQEEVPSGSSATLRLIRP